MRADGRHKVKQKRRKKDLEELHRNVLEAKQKLEETTHEKNGKKANPRICSKLLPEPIAGMYKNGAKGRQARRANGYMGGTLNARLEGNVLKLLNGDETNTDSSENSEVRSTKKTEQACLKKTIASDSPVRGKTKGNKWMNRVAEKNITSQEETMKPRNQPHPQRKNACKKRLFEPDDENAFDEHNFQNIDCSKIMDDICFSPTRRMDVCNSESDNDVKKYSIPNEDGASEKSKGKLDLERLTKKFWDCSPYVRYESFCTKVCSENFESSVQCIGRDPIIKIRKTLKELYTPSNRWMEANVREKHCRLPAASKSQNSLADNPSLSCFTGTENGTSDFEMEQESSDSGMIKVGSWHSSNFRGVSSENNDTPIQDTMKRKKSRVKDSKDVDARRKPKKNDPQRIAKKNRVCEENSSINSVTLFLKTLRDNSPMNGRKGRKTFAAKVAAAAELCRVKETSDNYRDEPQDSSTDTNIKSLVRKNAKHIPAILRRSKNRASLVKRINDNPQDIRRRGEKRFPCSDSAFTEYPRHSTGSSSSSVARLDDSDLVKTPSIARRLSAAEPEDLTKFNSTRTKSKRREKNIERDVSCDGLSDAESFDDTSRTELRPVGQYVEKNHTRKARTRVAQSRLIEHRRVTFDADDDDRPFHFQTSKPSKRRPDLLPAPSNRESLAPYHGDPRSECSKNFSRQENNVKTAPQDLHPRLVASVSEIDRQSQNRNFETHKLPTFRDENLSSDRFATESEYARPAPAEKRIRKPVMLFKPIQSIGNDRQSYQSRHESLDNAFATVSDAVRNLKVHSHTEDPRNPTQQQQTASLCQNHYLEHQHQRYPEQALTRTISKNPVISINQNASQREIFDSQPAKFLALQQGDGDPQRVPVCTYLDRPRVVGDVPVVHRQDSSGIAAFDDTNNSKLTCIKCLEPKKTTQQSHHQFCCHQVDPACAYRSSILDRPSSSYAKLPSPLIPSGTADGGSGTVFGMAQQSQCQNLCAEHQAQLSQVACPSMCSQQKRCNELAPAAASTLRPTSKDLTRNGCDIQLASSQQTHPPQCGISTGFKNGFPVNSRIQLADGTIGTFIPDSSSACGMGQQNRHDISHGATQLSFVGARSSPFFQQRAANNVAVATAPRNFCSIPGCEQVASTQHKCKHQCSVANFKGNFNEHETLSNRIQLADGTIGRFVPESRSVGNTGFFNNDRRTFNPIRRDETGCGQDPCVSGSQEICSSSVCRWNPVRHCRH